MKRHNTIIKILIGYHFDNTNSLPKITVNMFMEYNQFIITDHFSLKIIPDPKPVSYITESVKLCVKSPIETRYLADLYRFS